MDVTKNDHSSGGTSNSSSHHVPLDIDHRSISLTSEFGNNGDEDSLDSPEAVLWRRGQLLGKGAFGSVWLALNEKVSK